MKMTPEEYKNITTVERIADNGDTKVAFVYVPKTGGTYLSINIVPKKYVGKTYRPSTMPGNIHMPASRVMNLVDPDTPFFTMIRDPYDRTCSEFYFIKNKTEASISHLNWNLSDQQKIKFLAQRSGQIMRSQLFYEKTHAIYSNNMTVEDYLEWSTKNPTYEFYYDKKTPSEFEVVGLTEKIEKTKELLKIIYGMSSGNGNYNNNQNKNIGQQYETKYSRKCFEKKNYIDYELYVQGKENFQKLVEKHL